MEAFSRIPLSPRDRRALLVGCALAVAAILYAGVAKPYLRSVAAAKSTVTAHRELLERERSLLAESPSVKGELTTARAAATRIDRRLYQDRDPIAATAALSRDV